jgi:hypothetical protein
MAHVTIVNRSRAEAQSLADHAIHSNYLAACILYRLLTSLAPPRCCRTSQLTGVCLCVCVSVRLCLSVCLSDSIVVIAINYVTAVCCDCWILCR